VAIRNALDREDAAPVESFADHERVQAPAVQDGMWSAHFDGAATLDFDPEDMVTGNGCCAHGGDGNRHNAVVVDAVHEVAGTKFCDWYFTYRRFDQRVG
jgi:hypothetical protein